MQELLKKINRLDIDFEALWRPHKSSRNTYKKWYYIMQFCYNNHFTTLLTDKLSYDGRCFLLQFLVTPSHVGRLDHVAQNTGREGVESWR